MVDLWGAGDVARRAPGRSLTAEPGADAFRMRLYIWAEGKVGEGAAFYFSLNADEIPQPAGPPERPGQPLYLVILVISGVLDSSKIEAGELVLSAIDFSPAIVEDASRWSPNQPGRRTGGYRLLCRG